MHTWQGSKCDDGGQQISWYQVLRQTPTRQAEKRGKEATTLSIRSRDSVWANLIESKERVSILKDWCVSIFKKYIQLRRDEQLRRGRWALWHVCRAKRKKWIIKSSDYRARFRLFSAPYGRHERAKYGVVNWLQSERTWADSQPGTWQVDNLKRITDWGNWHSQIWFGEVNQRKDDIQPHKWNWATATGCHFSWPYKFVEFK